MIAFLDNLPMIQLANGHSVVFEREWLTRSLARAAAKAGYQNWWLADHVAQSVTDYLRTQRETNLVPVEQLNHSVRTVLEVIGYAEVGQQFESGRPRVQVSLVELALEAGSGYELAFFELLGRQIQELVQRQGCDFELLGLDRCVKLLKARKSWSRDCDSLRNEIIAFTRSQTELAAGQNEVAFALS